MKFRIAVSCDRKRGERIKQEQCVDDKRITKHDGFLYLKVRMTQHTKGAKVGLVSFLANFANIDLSTTAHILLMPRTAMLHA